MHHIESFFTMPSIFEPFGAEETVVLKGTAPMVNKAEHMYVGGAFFIGREDILEC